MGPSSGPHIQHDHKVLVLVVEATNSKILFLNVTICYWWSDFRWLLNTCIHIELVWKVLIMISMSQVASLPKTTARQKDRSMSSCFRGGAWGQRPGFGPEAGVFLASLFLCGRRVGTGFLFWCVHLAGKAWGPILRGAWGQVFQTKYWGQ